MDLNDNYIHVWQPFESFQKNSLCNGINAGTHDMALLILNQPINETNELKLIQLWRRSVVKFCVDGGANRLYGWQMSKLINQGDKEKFIPDYICGDLDSTEPHVLNFYESNGCKVFRLFNQCMTDFEKALRFAVNCVRNGQVDASLIDNNGLALCKYSLKESDIQQLSQIKFERINCFCEFGGRLDHSLANLSSLYSECLERINTYIVCSEAITFLLAKGTNIIYIDNDLLLGQYCGLFPLGNPAVVSTIGLKWDVSKQLLKFGTFISSSNEFKPSNQDKSNQISNSNDKKNFGRRHVIVETDQPIIWTMSIK